MAPRTGDDDGGTPPFTIVVAFRDTPRERAFAEKSIPSAIALGPDELVVGIDGAGEGGGPGAYTFDAVPQGARDAVILELDGRIGRLRGHLASSHFDDRHGHYGRRGTRAGS